VNILKMIIGWVSLWMDKVSGSVLILMMLLTVMDVVLRFFKKPIPGTYELVALAGGVLIAFAVPQTSKEHGQITMDLFPEGRYMVLKNIFFVFTRILGIVFFALLTWYLFQKAGDLRRMGDVTTILNVPLYPVAYGIALCFFVESLVLLMEILTKSTKGVDNV
jgi:TRAP-type C4-dicarboxylate transport system permease small subunit